MIDSKYRRLNRSMRSLFMFGLVTVVHVLWRDGDVKEGS